MRASLVWHPFQYLFGVVSVPGFVRCNWCVVVSCHFSLKSSNNMKGFLGDSVVKNPPANAGVTADVGLISGSGRSPRVGNDHTLQYSCQENSMDRGTQWIIVHRVTKSWARLSNWACMHVTTWHLVCFHMLFSICMSCLVRCVLKFLALFKLSCFVFLIFFFLVLRFLCIQFFLFKNLLCVYFS